MIQVLLALNKTLSLIFFILNNFAFFQNDFIIYVSILC
jgi:hypothetical protein